MHLALLNCELETDFQQLFMSEQSSNLVIHFTELQKVFNLPPNYVIKNRLLIPISDPTEYFSIVIDFSLVFSNVLVI